VHVTEGAESDFAGLYILVIAVSGMTMPFASNLLITLLAALLYVADIVWGHPVQISVAVYLQIGVFLAVAFAVGRLAQRLHVVGAQRSVLEKEVHRLRLEASDILHGISSGVVTVDEEGILVYANSAAQRLLGFSSAEWVERPFVQFLQSRASELSTAILETQSKGRQQVRVEGNITIDGRSYPIGVTTTLHRVEEGGQGSVTAIFTDISDQKRLEDLNLRAERLAAVAELSASLAHEIKNPLASIRSSVEQLSGSGRANEDEQALAELIVRESDRLSRVLSEFLDFSRVQLRDARPVDLAVVARRAVELVRGHPDCPPDAEIVVVGGPVPICGDEDLLHRVVVNLTLNALQASGGEARVTIDVREAGPADIPSTVALAPFALLAVSDDGPGIPEEVRDRMFEPFVTGRIGGTGLGLAIVQRAVAAHRGIVLVDSEPNVGTTFRILLPTNATEEAVA
jgi:two-component system sensor histidine kinase PilS (NtrC family)